MVGVRGRCQVDADVLCKPGGGLRIGCAEEEAVDEDVVVAGRPASELLPHLVEELSMVVEVRRRCRRWPRPGPEWEVQLRRRGRVTVAAPTLVLFAPGLALELNQAPHPAPVVASTEVADAGGDARKRVLDDVFGVGPGNPEKRCGCIGECEIVAPEEGGGEVPVLVDERSLEAGVEVFGRSHGFVRRALGHQSLPTFEGSRGRNTSSTARSSTWLRRCSASVAAPIRASGGSFVSAPTG